MQSRELDAVGLATQFPPKLRNANKKLVYEKIGPPKGGRLIVTRWGQTVVPSWLTHHTKVTLKKGVFDYAKSYPTAKVWYLNFADKRLFMGYGGGLFAQDESQVAEHPVLASLREYLLVKGGKDFPPITKTDTHATPILIRDVPRQAIISTKEIYDYRFEKASRTTIQRAVKVLPRPTLSNIIAISAPSGGRGVYTRKQIEQVLATTCTGFDAAITESKGAKVIVHTGGWGTGAFGGNKVLMPLLQMLAADMVGIDQLVYHAMDPKGVAAYKEAFDLFGQLTTNTRSIVDTLVGMKFRWGTSDGN